MITICPGFNTDNKYFSMLNLLSSQMAISIENSLRTRELEQEIIIRKQAEEALAKPKVRF